MAITFSKDDFRRIRWNLAAALAMAIAGVAAVYAAMQMHAAEKKNFAAAQAKRGEIQGRLSRARDEEQELKQKIARYAALERQGVFREEMRLDWIEQIRRIKAAHKLFDIQYEIAPQQLIDPALLPGSSANYDFLSSTMQLRMKLLHEDDLLNFLNDFKAEARAFVRVRRCDIERLPRQGSETGGVPPQLGADCTLELITVRERKTA